MPRVVYAQDRLKRPLLRDGPRGSGQFKEIEWPEALDRVATRLMEVKEKSGCGAILGLSGSGACRGALHNTSILTERFLGLLGKCTGITGSYSSGAVSFVTPLLFGTRYTGLDPETLRFSRAVILWGANISDTRFGCELETRLREYGKEGAPIVVIDPRRSRTVDRLGAEWIPVWPGTDSVLMAAVLYVLLREGLVDRSFIQSYSVGFEVLEQYVLGRIDGTPKTPAWATKRCGTPEQMIEALALRYGTTKPTALIPGLSIQRTLGGEEASRMAVALQVATGNVGVMGGSSGGPIWNALPKPRCGVVGRGSMKVAAPDACPSPAIPVYRWADAVLEGKSGGYPTDIGAIYNVGENYLCQGSDIRKNIAAFERVDFSVCHDYFLTSTARYCDIVLPATTFLEREDVVFANENYLLYSHQAIEPVGEARNDYDIFCQLAERLGFLEAYSENRTGSDWLARFIDESEIEDKEEFKRTGIYRAPDQRRVAFASFVSDPDSHPLSTPSGRIELASEQYVHKGFSLAPSCRITDPETDYPLRLVSPHSRYRTNSQYSNDSWFREREPQVLWMNPKDAKLRSIDDGATARVATPQGEMIIPVRVTRDITPGVVCLFQGVWPGFGGDGIERAGSVNVLTSTVPTKPSQSSRTHSVFVEVRSARGEAFDEILG